MTIYHPPNDSKSSRTLKRFYPHYIDQEYPHFAAMMEAYFEWLDRERGAYDVSKNIPKYSQIRTTIDDFIEYFREHYLHYIPLNVLADKSLLVRYIKQFYLAKGTEKAYKFLFRILYDEDIELYYPSVDLLRASDGKWIEERSIKVTSTAQNPAVFESRLIRGSTTGASALVERAGRTKQQNVDVTELFLSNISGSFVYGEIITCIDENDDIVATETIYGVYQSVTVTNAGTMYRLNDPFYIRDGFGNKIGSGLITSVQTGGIDDLIIVEPGINYRGLYKLVQSFNALQINFIYNGSPLSEQAISDYASQVIGETIGSNGILIQQTPDAIIITDGDSESSGGGASGQIVLVGNNGDILQVKLLTRGVMYSEPVVTIETSTGSGGSIRAVTTGGQIQTVQLFEFPIEVLNPSVDFSTRGNGDAAGQVNLGTLIRYPGRWINTDSHLSSDKRLQDNYYWQDFSYVIKGDVLINQYRQLVKDAIHPAGLIVFGELQATFDALDDRYGIETIDEIDLETELLADLPHEHETTSIQYVEIDVDLMDGLPAHFTFTRASDATYIDADGNRQTATSNEPRFEYDPDTSKFLGLLREPARTNLYLQSNDASNAAHYKDNVSISGTDVVVENTANSSHAIIQSFTLAGNTAYTGSAELEAIDRRYVQAIVDPGDASSFKWATFDLQDGVVTETGGTDTVATIRRGANGKWLCAITFTTVAVPTDPYIGWYASENPTGFYPVYLGTGVDAFSIREMQMEAGLCPTSRIRTTGTSANRAVDAILLSGTAFGDRWNDTEGTAYVEASFANDPGSGTTPFILTFNDDTTSNRINLYINKATNGVNIFIATGGVQQTLTGVSGAAKYTGETMKLAAAWKNSSARMAIDGVLTALDTTITVPTCTQMQIGDQNLAGAASRDYPVHIRKLQYWPERLEDALLANLTS